MSDDFDPYAEWLNIAAGNDAPTHYELLGLELDETDVAKIRRSYQERYENIHRYTVGNYSDAAIVIQGELSQACECLTNPAARRQYDATLRAAQARDLPKAGNYIPIEEHHRDGEAVKSEATLHSGAASVEPQRTRIANLQEKAKALRAERDRRNAKIRKERLAGWKGLLNARIDFEFPSMDDPLLAAAIIGTLAFLFWVVLALIT
jgi:hypothetical protein